jgi:hypothetical protein
MILIALNTFSTIGQNKFDRYFQIHDVKKSDIILSKDTSMFSFSIADSVVKSIRSRKIKQTAFSRQYIDGRMFFPYSITFSKSELKLDNISTLTYNKKDYNFQPNDTVFVCGFSCYYAPSRIGSAAQNISKFYMSAYLQEIDKKYTINNLFVKLPAKDFNEFRKRNWISMGYGKSYSLKNNPFASAKGMHVGLAYLCDAFTTFMIVGGPFIGETTQDKIAIPILGIVFNVILKKFLIGRSSELNVDSYNSIVNSKYGIPSNLEY